MRKMIKNNLTKKDLNDLGERFENNFDLKLGKFTDDVLLPAVKNIVHDEIDSQVGKFRHELKDYIDDKLAETKGDIISYIKGDQERDKNWKFKIVNILKREKLAKPQELKILSNLIR